MLKFYLLTEHSVQEMPGRRIEVDSFSYSAVIRALKHSLLWEDALATLSHMPFNLRDHVCYNSAILCMPWTWAVQLLQEMRNQQNSLDAISYGSCLATFQRATQWQKSLSLQMELWEMHLSNTVIENTVLGSCARAAQQQITLHLLDAMELRGTKDTRSCGIAMMAFSDGFSEASLELLSRLLEQKGQPDVVCCTTVIRTCAAAAEWRMAFEILHLMSEILVKANSWSYNSLINACEAASQWQMALFQLHDMKKHTLDPDVITFNSTLSSFQHGDANSWLLALQLLDEMPQHRLVPDILTINSTLSACYAWPIAFALLQALLGTQPVSGISFGTVINKCERVGEWEVALALLHQMLALDYEPDGRILGSVISVVGREVSEDVALALFSSLQLWVEGVPSINTKTLTIRPDVLAAAPGILTLCKPSMQRTEELIAEVAESYPHVTVVSRLDSPTSGVLPIILAKDGSRVARCFQAQFAGRLVDKDYICLCEGPSLGVAGTTGEVQKPLRTIGNGQFVRREVSTLGKPAKSEYWIRARYEHPGVSGSDELILLHVKLLTGRTHQIRVHFASLGRPLVGDLAYGKGIVSPFTRLFLHCRRLALRDAAGRRFVAKAPLPFELMELLGKLKPIEERPP